MKHSKKQLKKAELNLYTFLQVFGYLTEDLKPTEKASGFLVINDLGEIGIIKPKGSLKLDQLIKKNFKAFALISKMNTSTMTLREVRNELITKSIII